MTYTLHYQSIIASTSEPYIIFDRIVPENNTGSCGTYKYNKIFILTILITLLTKSPVKLLIFTPSSNISPLVTLYKPPNKEEMVLLPEPEPPTIPIFSPGLATKSIEKKNEMTYLYYEELHEMDLEDKQNKHY